MRFTFSLSDPSGSAFNFIAIKAETPDDAQAQLKIIIFILTTSVTELRQDGYTTVPGLSFLSLPPSPFSPSPQKVEADGRMPTLCLVLQEVSSS